MRVVLATSNAGKVKELQEALAPLGWELLSLADYPVTLPEEDAATYEDNAALKACAVAVHTGLPALADDSGVEVTALNGEPGIFSARFGNKNSDLERNVYLLERMRGVSDRSARFIAALVLAYPDGFLEVYRGEIGGRILEGPRGLGGFGYDPLFEVENTGRTFAEMSLEEKRAVSHRGRALQALLEAHRNGPPERQKITLE
ncbi:XTP/dITP diphosphohydrolase [Deinobacterium chartae]|uniref:dITP/XTP pyrophosphatase n=1 Tax=Deinobacterium chartae TaxID=521158 RepID=A0A841I5P6_9DEIO|nr:RdgB/HAM1 family non-canonical purine NTP pyrophosphatase [Deinobacterium chartae]MBB6099768.1 XTP/dITP diphosphohydrolase [Deinobacterium chartae]